jgi:SAM-dependent methyltransferase
MPYNILPGGYDLLTWDVDYPAMGRYIRSLLLDGGIASGIVLDLACGTGTMSFLLSGYGYEVIGVDSSEAMLSQAYAKLDGYAGGAPPVFIRQRMQNLDLYGTCAACVSTLDSINHIADPAELLEVFKRVSLFLDPGGLFIFDINSREKLERMEGCTFSDEREGVFCVWRAASAGDRLYSFRADLFTRSGKLWSRGTDEYFEYAYEVSEIIGLLEKAGFSEIAVYGGMSKNPPGHGEERIYFRAKK